MTIQPALPGMNGTATARRRSRFLRALMGAWLAVHAFVIGAAPIADALTEHAAANVARWTDASRTNSPPEHDPQVCQLCQVVSATFGGAVGPELAPARLVLSEAPTPSEVGLADPLLTRRGSASPRGPPPV